MEGLNPKNITTADQHENICRAKIYWLARNPGAFIERFIRENWWEFKTVQPPTPFYPRTNKRPLPVPQKDRVPPQIPQKSPARHQTFRPLVLPVPLQPVVPILVQSVAPLWVVKLIPQYLQTKLRTISEGTSREQTSQRPQTSPRVIPASQHWKEIRISWKNKPNSPITREHYPYRSDTAYPYLTQCLPPSPNGLRELWTFIQCPTSTKRWTKAIGRGEHNVLSHKQKFDKLSKMPLESPTQKTLKMSVLWLM